MVTIEEMELERQYTQASIKTADNLRSIAQSGMLQEVSQLSLPEIEAIVNEVSEAVPAGNVPGIILSGLVRFTGRRPPQENVKRDINLLFKGVESALGKGAYAALFAGPAAVLWGYQNLLKLAGKDTAVTFSEGVWQFYADYGLRDDTARHTMETNGFELLLSQHHLDLSPTDRLTAWVMTAVHTLHQYPDLLANEWRERVYISLLGQVTGGQAADYLQAWEQNRPYSRRRDADPAHTYAAYRSLKFDQFMDGALRQLTIGSRQEWQQRVQAVKADKSAYQQQLSILAYLEPAAYGETRIPFPITQAHVGLIYQGRYYLLPICESNGQPTSVTAMRQQIHLILNTPTARTAVNLTTLAKMKRSELPRFRERANNTLVRGLDDLRLAPILINADLRPHNLPLAEIRQAERGIGDHPLTLFNSSKSVIFDQSTIFFDASWGASLAEIMTHEAMSWAVYIHTLSPLQTAARVIKPLPLPFESADSRFIKQAVQVQPEVSAESTGVQQRLLLTTCQLLQQRHKLINLTMDDLLVLYRTIHAATYQPDPNLVAELGSLKRDRRYETAVNIALAAMQTSTDDTAVLIPADASRNNPQARLYPLIFDLSLSDTGLLDLHQHSLEALSAFQNSHSDQQTAYEAFDQLRRTYLTLLAGLAQAMNHAREIVLTRQDAGAGNLKLVGNLPGPVQHLLEALPGRHDPLSDVMRGRELFIYVSSLPTDTSLTRFAAAKDDSIKRVITWGSAAASEGALPITLRDFRPHVTALAEIGHKPLAARITQHYAHTYAQGLNQYLRELRRIALANRN